MAGNPIHQFAVEPIFPLVPVEGLDVSFTNASAYMVLTVALVSAFMILGSRKRLLVPGRLQLAAELFYQNIENLVVSSISASAIAVVG